MVPSIVIFFAMCKDELNRNLIYGDLIDVTIIEKGTSDGVSGGFENYYEFRFINKKNKTYNDTLSSTIQMDRKGNNFGDFILHSAINDTVTLKTYNKNSGRIVKWKNKEISYQRSAHYLIKILEILFWGTIGFFCIRGIIKIWKRKEA